jgi:hypothetical protein
MTACGFAHDAGSESRKPTASPSGGSKSAGQLTPQGARLSFGDSATVAYRPRQGRGTQLALVVRAATKGSVHDFAGLQVDQYTTSSTPYYVDVSVRNVGDSPVGEAPVPLWGVDEEARLLPPAGFARTFEPCPSEELPAKFSPGDRLATCLVFLAPKRGALRAVSFRPSQEFRPIVWTGAALNS